MKMLAFYNAEHKARSIRLGGKSNVIIFNFKQEPAVSEVEIPISPVLFFNEKPSTLLEWPDPDKTPSIREVMIAVASEMEISTDQLISVKRNRPIASARHIAFYLCHSFADRSLKQIGRDFKRDHTTVMSGIRKIEKKIITDGKTQDLVSLLSRRIAPLRASPYWGA